MSHHALIQLSHPMKILFALLSLSPALLNAQVPGRTWAQLPPKLVDEYTASNVRPHMVMVLRQRSEALNRRLDAITKEQDTLRKNEELAEKRLEKLKDEHGRPAIRPLDREYDDHSKFDAKIEDLRQEMEDFQKEAAAEFRIKRQQAADLEKSKQAAISKAEAHAKAVAAANPPEQSRTGRTAAVSLPAPAPIPSSVPGFPAGVEPAKKKAGPTLPPGMTRGK